MATNNPAPQRGTRQVGTSTSQAKSVPASAEKEANKTKATAKTQGAKPAPATGSSSVATRTASTLAPAESGTKVEPKAGAVERGEKPAAEPGSSLVRAVGEAQEAPAAGSDMEDAVDTLISDEITREAVERSAGNTSSPILHVVDMSSRISAPSATARRPTWRRRG